MNRLVTLLAVLCCMFTASIAQAQTAPKKKNMKSIVIYFSRSGNNYVNGSIVNLPMGNTKVLAQKIQSETGCDVFEIVPQNAYPADYMKCTEVAQQEINRNAYPAYVGEVDLSAYTTIYLGYPIWWGTFPRCVNTFIKNHDGLKGKTVLPFSTHEGSGLGTSVSDLKKLCPQATVKKSIAVKGSTVKTASVSAIINQ